MNHLKTHKCIEIQKSIDNYDALLIAYKRKINEMKCAVRDGEIIE